MSPKVKILSPLSKRNRDLERPKFSHMSAPVWLLVCVLVIALIRFRVRMHPCVRLSICPCGLSCRRERSLWLKIIALRRYYGNGLQRPVSLRQQLEMCGYGFSAIAKPSAGHYRK